MSLSRPVLLAMLVSSSALVAVSAQIVSTRTGSKSAALPDTMAKSANVPDPAARSIIANLDALVQKRFATVMRFGGINRFVAVGSNTPLHPPDFLYAAKPEERRLLAKADTFKRPCELFFLHYKPLPKTLKPGSFGRSLGYPPEARFSSDPALAYVASLSPLASRPALSLKGVTAKPETALQWAKRMKPHEDELKQIVVAHIPALERGESVSTLYKNDWYMETRPVVAHSAECLTCHTNVQKGATMAAMVYLVKKDIPGNPSHPSKAWSDFAHQP